MNQETTAVTQELSGIKVKSLRVPFTAFTGLRNVVKN